MAADQGRSSDQEHGIEADAERQVSTDRPGGSEERPGRYDGSHAVGPATGASTRPPYLIVILAVVVAIVILGGLVLLLSR